MLEALRARIISGFNNILTLEGISKIRRILSQSHNFNIQVIIQIINFLIKSYRIRLNKGEPINEKEKNELNFRSSCRYTKLCSFKKGYFGKLYVTSILKNRVVNKYSTLSIFFKIVHTKMIKSIQITFSRVFT